MQDIEVLIIGRHRIVVEGLSRVFERDARLSTIGCACSFTEAEVLLTKLAPDVVLLYLSLLDGRALKELARLKRFRPRLAFVVLTDSEEGAQGDALKAGADLCLGKDWQSDAVIDAICGVTDGAWQSPRPVLSAREADVARLVAQGLSNVEIARALCLSINTVKTYLKGAMGKLNVPNRTSLALKMRELDYQVLSDRGKNHPIG
jgi:two-component system NarL family response regulator